MSSWNRIMECVPNFSEGRDLGKIEKIIFCEFNLDTACMEQGLRNVIGEYFNRIAGPCLED